MQPRSAFACLAVGTALSWCGSLVAPTRALAQQGEDWNGPRALSLMDRARDVRQRARGDSALTSYRADARGYVYFYLNRADTGENSLVKTDQIALEVYWKAPDSTKQRIVGLRDEERLPTNIRYHLDHLTVVQDEFQDLIRLGDGDEVSAVMHPAAAGSGGVYDFRMGDSITIEFPGDREPVRVYEIEVRPQDFTRPGIIGSVFVDRRNGAIVRMTFTFTSASYVDDYLDYIRISLDNSLWDGRYWLPYEQHVEIRRELPYFDFGAGSVIRGRYEIRNYRFNESLPPLLFLGGPVAAVPEAQRRAFPFEEDLYAQVDREGLSPPPELSEIRQEAARIARDQYLSGLGRSRLWAEDASAVLRSNRVEGTVLGAGFALHPFTSTRLRVGLGYAFGRERPVTSASLAWTGGNTSVRGTAEWNALRDLGPSSAASGALNTLAWMISDRDFLDPYFASGARVRIDRQFPQGSIAVTGGVSELRWSDATVGRPVRPIDPGTEYAVAVEVARQEEGGFTPYGQLGLGRLSGSSYGWAGGSLAIQRAWLASGVSLGARIEGGWTSGAAPLHRRVLLGGRGTLPGYTFRSFAGDRHMLARVEGAQSVRDPWLRLGVFGAVGATWLRPESVPGTWSGTETGLARYTAGFTASALWDVLQLELGRGLNGGRWELQLYVAKRFWPWL